MQDDAWMCVSTYIDTHTRHDYSLQMANLINDNKSPGFSLSQHRFGGSYFAYVVKVSVRNFLLGCQLLHLI